MRHFFAVVSLVSLVSFASGCGDGGGGSGTAGNDSGGSGGNGSGGTGGNGSGGSGGTDTGGSGSAEDVPAEKAALFAYLKAGKYKTLTAESAAHPSSGPHSGDVRVFINASLKASLAAGSASHAAGAASVKELGVEGGEPSGWAVLVKTSDDSQGGDGIFWYEIFNTVDGSNPPYAGNGLPICKNCHVGGADFYLSAYPLE